MINVKLDKQLEPVRYDDPFLQPYDDLRDLDGLDQNFKRRHTRLSKSFVGIDGAKSQRIDDVGVIYVGYNMFDVIEPPFNLTQLAQYYDMSGAHHSAVNIKVSNAVGLGYGFEPTPRTVIKLEDIDNEDQLRRAGRKIERIKVALEDWLESLNEEDSFVTTLEKVMTDYESIGNGYMEIGRTSAGDIAYIGHIPASTMRVRRLRDGYVQIAGGRAVYFRNFQSTTPNPMNTGTRPNEVIHFKKYSPNDSYYGIPDILSSSAALVGNSNATKFNMDFFQHRAVPRNIVIVKNATLDSESEDKLFQFLQGLKGKNHRTLYIPLNADDPDKKIEFDIKPIEADITDMSFDKYQEVNNREIFMTHGTPIIKSGASPHTTTTQGLQADRTFNEQYVRPTQRKIEKYVNRIIAEQTDIIRIKFKAMTLLDESTMSQIHERYLRWDVVTPNEVREAFNKPARDGGDDTVGVMAQAELKLKQAGIQAKAQANATRERDQQRQAANPDDPASPNTRNPKSLGRQQQ